jgi:hypothetical protein
MEEYAEILLSRGDVETLVLIWKKSLCCREEKRIRDLIEYNLSNLNDIYKFRDVKTFREFVERYDTQQIFEKEYNKEFMNSLLESKGNYYAKLIYKHIRGFSNLKTFPKLLYLVVKELRIDERLYATLNTGVYPLDELQKDIDISKLRVVLTKNIFKYKDVDTAIKILKIYDDNKTLYRKLKDNFNNRTIEQVFSERSNRGNMFQKVLVSFVFQSQQSGNIEFLRNLILNIKCRDTDMYQRVRKSLLTYSRENMRVEKYIHENYHKLF